MQSAAVAAEATTVLFAVFFVAVAITIAVAISVTVTISITVAITIAVGIALGIGFHVAEQYGEVLNLVALIHFFKIVEIALVNLGVANHIDCEVDISVDEGGIGDECVWHGVENDVVVLLLENVD